MNDDTIRYVDALPATRRAPNSSSDLPVFLTRIAERAGTWAVYRENLRPTTAYVYATRFGKKYPHAEFSARKQDDGTCTLFARVASQS